MAFAAKMGLGFAQEDSFSVQVSVHACRPSSKNYPMQSLARNSAPAVYEP
jgi:hypothetical protein